MYVGGLTVSLYVDADAATEVHPTNGVNVGIELAPINSTLRHLVKHLSK